MKPIGLILAGGKSTRMGQDKAGLIWNGLSLLQHQVRTVAAVVGADRVLISGDRPGYDSVADLTPGRGPVEGLFSALGELKARCGGGGVLVVPVDMPFLTPALLRQLLPAGDSILDARSDALFFIGHTLPVFFSDLDRLESVIRPLRGDRCPRRLSFRSILENLKVKAVAAQSESALLNMNTLEEWNDAVSKTNATF